MGHDGTSLELLIVRLSLDSKSNNKPLEYLFFVYQGSYAYFGLFLFMKCLTLFKLNYRIPGKEKVG